MKSPGAYLFQTHLKGECLIEARGVLNLANTMVSVLHKGLEYKVENLSNKKLEVMQTRNHPGSVHTKFYSRD